MTEVECFDPLTNEWTLSKALPESRSIDPEMQKVADASDISVLFFFQLVLIFGRVWVIFGPFFCANFLWQNMPLCYLNRFLQLCTCCHRRFNHFLAEREIGKK